MTPRCCGGCLRRENIGSPYFLDVKFAEDAEFHAKIRYTIPLSWCHSFDPAAPIGENEGDDNLPVVQGGLSKFTSNESPICL